MATSVPELATQTGVLRPLSAVGTAAYHGISLGNGGIRMRVRVTVGAMVLPAVAAMSWLALAGLLNLPKILPHQARAR